MLRWGTGGGCLLFAVFCAYGFLASGELNGAEEMAWKTGYAIAGGIALLAAVILVSKRNKGTAQHNFPHVPSPRRGEGRVRGKRKRQVIVVQLLSEVPCRFALHVFSD